MQPWIHPFEASGLGKAPFVCTGMTENAFCPAPGVNMAGGSCDYCGTGIRWEFWIKSADSKRFKVGCDCVYKTERTAEDHAATMADRAARAAATRLANQVKNLKKEAVKRAKAMSIDSALAALTADSSLLTGEKHPSISGKSLRDYAQFLLTRGGAAGKAKGARFVRDAIAKAIELDGMADGSAVKVERLAVIDANKAAIASEAAEKQAAFDERKRAAQAVIDDRKALKASSRYVGTIGERRDFTDMTVTALFGFETVYGYMTVHVMRDPAGNVIVYKGKRLERDKAGPDGEYMVIKGDLVSFKATVKGHIVYQDKQDDMEIKQTVVNRPGNYNIRPAPVETE